MSQPDGEAEQVRKKDGSGEQASQYRAPRTVGVNPTKQPFGRIGAVHAYRCDHKADRGVHSHPRVGTEPIQAGRAVAVTEQSNDAEDPNRQGEGA